MELSRHLGNGHQIAEDDDFKIIFARDSYSDETILDSFDGVAKEIDHRTDYRISPYFQNRTTDRKLIDEQQS